MTFDPDHHTHLREMIEHVPLLGMIAAATRSRAGGGVEFWHLIVAMIGLGVLLGSTFGTIIWNQASKQTDLEAQIRQLRIKDDQQDGADAYTRRRQEINEERLNRLETDDALSKEFESRMIREHADIYQAIRGGRR